MTRRRCVRTSAGKYKHALWDGKKLCLLSDQETPEMFAAEQVKIPGVLYEKTGIVKVGKIERAR